MRRIRIRLGRWTGELDLRKRDLADLCNMRPGTAGAWISGIIERISLEDLAMICDQMELEITDILELEDDGQPRDPKGRAERILAKVNAVRVKRRAADREKRKMKTIRELEGYTPVRRKRRRKNNTGNNSSNN